jgi:riboflavin synthase alpha subunit
MITRRIRIPLTQDRAVLIGYKQQDNGMWVSTMSDETMTDIVNHFNNGYYQLDGTSLTFEDILGG